MYELKKSNFVRSLTRRSRGTLVGSSDSAISEFQGLRFNGQGGFYQWVAFGNEL